MITQEMVEIVAAVMNPYWFEDNAEGEFPEQVEQKRRLWRSYAEKGIKAVYPMILEQAAKEVERRYMGDNNREDVEVRKCAQAIRNLKDKTDE